MILRFPNPDCLLLALASSAVPAEVALAPLAAAREEDGGFVVRSSLAMPLTALTQLFELGVCSAPIAPPSLAPFPHWFALVPLRALGSPPVLTDKTLILFDLPAANTGEVVGEMLRLGNDRQALRRLQSVHGARTLLRVVAPPYYTLLRALDQPLTTATAGLAPPPAASVPPTAPVAYYEQAPRVWVALGYEHPLAARLRPAEGEMLLLRPPNLWETFPEGPFQDLYQTLDYRLPAAAAEWSPADQTERFRVPLRLTSSSAADPAELWVLTDDARSQVDALVASSDNELIARLAFAVVERAGQSHVLLRVRPSKRSPPLLVLRGVGYRSYLQLPNLFLPVGRRLQPPLRRDAVVKLLAPDPQQLVWLHPLERGEFAPCTMPDASFRPLAQWVDYVLDQAHAPLSAWVASHRFDFARFEAVESPRPERVKLRPNIGVTKEPQTPYRELWLESSAMPILAEVVDNPPEWVSFPAQELFRELPQPAALQQELSRCEQAFLSSSAAPDAPEREEQWRTMARLTGALDRPHEAALCWSHLLWEQPQPSLTDVQSWWEQISESERGANAVAATSDPLAAFPTPAELEALVAGSPQRSLALRLAVGLIAVAALERASTGRDRGLLSAASLAQASRALTAAEGLLPVRIAWLAWLALAQLTHGDALALARARDRLLERLLADGLSAEHDLPAFLRAGEGDAGGDRRRQVREHLHALHALVRNGITEPPNPFARTQAYADLVFAYGWARLGDSEQAQRIVAAARQEIGTRDSLHSWLLAAYEQRISAAIAGAPRGPLPAELVQIMELMDRVDRYKADRLRQHSRILEPFERIDPYRRWHRSYADDFARELACLFDLTDRNELQSRLEQLLASPPPAAHTPVGAASLATTALELAPRLGERFAQRALAQLAPAWQLADDIVPKAWLLEKGLLVAAHFDFREALQGLVEQFERALPEVVAGYLNLQVEHSPERQERLTSIESLFQQSLRGLRKLGLRDEVERIFHQVTELVRRGAEASQRSRPGAQRSTPARDAARAPRLLLAVAGGWCFFGRYEQAQPVLEEVRDLLLKPNSGLPPLAKSQLACAYVSAAGQAPPEIALPLLGELFAQGPSGEPRLRGLVDTLTTSTHFSLAQLDLVEAVVLTLASDDFALSSTARRWLEEDEFYVRRRIHRDVRAALASNG